MYVIEIANPYEPLKDTRVTTFNGRIRLSKWLKRRFGKSFIEFDRPTLITINGKPSLRAEWDKRVLQKDDVVNIITLPGTLPVWAVWVIVAMSVASAIYAIIVARNLPKTKSGQIPSADPSYTLKGQSNQIKVGQPIESIYGSCRRWPSYAAQPYNQYYNNEQWLYQLFCIGQGYYNIGTLQIGDTPFSNFKNLEYEIVPPGGSVTLFPTNVETSPDVANIELPAMDEANFQVFGPFSVNPAGTRVTRVEIDVSVPEGLYKPDSSTGGISTNHTEALFSIRQIDDSGNPIGDWSEFYAFSATAATVNAQRYTFGRDVTSGRYQMKAYRSNSRGSSVGAVDRTVWDALRGFGANITNFGNVTMLAVKMQASGNLNSNSQTLFNINKVTRKLKTWDKVNHVWSDYTPTRSPIWAFVDILKSSYGGRLSDNSIDLDALADLDAILATRGDTFDFIFDQPGTVWDCSKMLGVVARCFPLINGTRVSMVRDSAQTIPTAVFSPDNIIKGTFKHQIVFPGQSENDGIELTYTDPTTWQPTTVMCCLPFEVGNYPKQVTLSGCSDRNQAYHEGMFQRACDFYLRENITFSTGREGHIPTYGDMVLVSHDRPKWGFGGLIRSVSGDVYNGTPVNKRLTLDRKLILESGVQYILGIRYKDGSFKGWWNIAQTDSNVVNLTASDFPEDLVFDDVHENPMYLIGTMDVSKSPKKCKVINLAPGDNDTVEVTCTNYDETVYGFDSYTPPAIGTTQGAPSSAIGTPMATGLNVVVSPNQPFEVIASWDPIAGAKYYVLQLSYDGSTWQTLGGGELMSTSFKFTVLPKYIYVRVAAVNVGAGDWCYWIGNAPLTTTNIVVSSGETPDAPTNIEATGGFGIIFLNWDNPTNTSLVGGYIRIYVSENTTKPSVYSYAVSYPTDAFSLQPLPNSATRYFWLEAVTSDGKVSSSSVMVSATTSGGVNLSDVIPGGLTVPEILGSLPTTGNFNGRLVYLIADDNVGGTWLKNKIYRWTSDTVATGKTYWTAEVSATDINGQITSTQIGANAVTSDKLAANSVTAGTIQAGAVTASAVGTNEIIANTANLKDGIITTAKIGDAQVTNAKIANLSADKITAGTISASVLLTAADFRAAKIATNSVFYNPGNTSSTFPSASTSSFQSSTNYVSGGASTTVYMLSVYGWNHSNGYGTNKYGKSQMVFNVSTICNFGMTNNQYCYIYLVYRINGGDWVQFSPPGAASQWFSVGALSWSVALTLNSNGNDIVDFGIYFDYHGGGLSSTALSVNWSNI